MADDTVLVRIPSSHWSQITSDIKNMCGTGNHADIEILADAKVLTRDEAMGEMVDGGVFDETGAVGIERRAYSLGAARAMDALFATVGAV